MKQPRFSRKLLLCAAALGFVASTGLYAAYGMAPDKARHWLARHGFAAAKIDSTRFYGDSFALTNITLDPNGFSTIRALRLQPDWTQIFGGGFVRGIIVDDMRLIGEWHGPVPDIAGWTPRLPAFPTQDEIILNGLRVDLDTPIGTIRLETKGRATRSPDGAYKAEAVLYGKQHELTIDSRWIGNAHANGAYAFEGEIVEGNLRTTNIDASRASGWLQIASELPEGAQQPITALSGQIQMGRLSLNDVPFGNVAVTLDGTVAEMKAIVTADVAGMPDARVNADLSRRNGRWHISATVTTKSAKDMLAFLVMLRQNMEKHNSQALSSFLITPGNVERLRRELSGLKYDELDLLVDGPANALHGSIVARTHREDRIERVAISLDPGTRR